MTWSVAYTLSSTDNYVNSFADYFFDTYLPSVPGFTVGPGSDAFERTVELTCDDIKGGTSSSYTWWDWTANSSTMYQYENSIYATTPGDNSDLYSSNSLGAVSTSGTSGAWRIWASSERADAFLVTRGDTGMMFWPGVGSDKWNLTKHNTWLAGASNSNTCVGMATNNYNGIPYCNNPGTTGGSTAEYQIVPAYGRVSTAYDTQDKSYLYTGVGYDFSDNTLNSGLGEPSGSPCLPGGASDQAVLSPPTVVSKSCLMQLTSASTISDSVGGNYYLMLGSSLDYMALCLDLGPTEPDLS